jgi:zinc transporter ZupT
MNENIFGALLLTLFAGLATGIGSVIGFFAKRTNKKFLCFSLGLSAGVMVYISFMEMLHTARIELEVLLGNAQRGDLLAAGMFFGGVILAALIDKLIPDKSLSLSEGAIAVNGFKSPTEDSWNGPLVMAVLDAYDADLTTPVKDFPKEALDALLYGTDKKFDFCGKDLSYGRNGSEFTVKLGRKNVKFTTRLLGLHSIIDIIGAIALAYTLGVEIPDLQFAVASLKPAEHRLELKPFTNGSLLIDDAYNSNPEGCLEAVRVLGSFDGMKKVIITPGLVELGDIEYDCNYALGKEATQNCDVIILVGTNRSKPMQDAVNNSDFNKENLYVAASFKEAMDIYSKIADNNTAVLFENDLPDNYLY